MTRISLYQLLSISFCLVVCLSNIISVKMVAFPYEGLAIPAGLIFYPLSSLLCNFVTEIYGGPKAKHMVGAAFLMSLLSYVIIQATLFLPTNDHHIQEAFEIIFALSGLRTVSSLAAYFTSQLVDIKVYIILKNYTSDRFLWIRNTGSILVSQLIDTLIIDLLYLGWGLGMQAKSLIFVMITSYAYKTFFSVSITPLLYFLVSIIKKNNRSSYLLDS